MTGPRIFEGHEGSIRGIEFSSDSQSLVTASSDLTARVWEVEGSGAPKKVLRGGHTAALSSAAFDAGGKRVVTGSADRTIRVWDVDREAEVVVLRWHGEAVNDVQFSPDGTAILSAADDGTSSLANAGRATGPSTICAIRSIDCRECPTTRKKTSGASSTRRGVSSGSRFCRESGEAVSRSVTLCEGQS